MKVDGRLVVCGYYVTLLLVRQAERSLERMMIPRSATTSIRTLVTTVVYGFQPNSVSIRRLPRRQSYHSMSKNWIDGDKRGRGQRPSCRANIATRQSPYRTTITTTTGLYFYHPQQKHSISSSSNISNRDHQTSRVTSATTSQQRDMSITTTTTSTADEKDDDTPLRLCIPTEEDMLEIGTMCAMLFQNVETDHDVHDPSPYPKRNGAVIFLRGDLGSGKSVWARGFIRGATQNWQAQVPSPTYLLSNTYYYDFNNNNNDDDNNKNDDDDSNPTNVEIHHMDLYRLQEDANQEYFMLNLDHVFQNCVSLIEWPERLPKHLVPEERLEISIESGSLEVGGGTNDDDDDMESTQQLRILTLTPFGRTWQRRVHDMRHMGYVDDLILKETLELIPNNSQE